MSRNEQSNTIANAWEGFSNDFSQPMPLSDLQKHISKDSRILEIGCGYGRVLNELYSLGYTNLCGNDVSEWMINRGKKQYPHLASLMTVSNGSSLEYADQEFDAVIMIGVLTCITDDSYQKILVNEIKRVTKPKGIICLCDFVINENFKDKYDAYYKSNNLTEDKYGTFKLKENATFRHYTPDHLRNLLCDYQIDYLQEEDMKSSIGGTPDRVINIIGTIKDI